MQSIVKPDSESFKCTRKSSIILRESMSSTKIQKRRRDPETAAMLANCDFVVEKEKQKPLKKKSKKVSKKIEMNKAFFTALSRDVDIRSTSFLS